MDVTVDRLTDLPPGALSALLADSERAGWRFVRRLADEWAAAANRFDRPGEALFGAWAGDRLVGVCGLNVDPYAADPTVGRVRRLYVLAECRRLGVGRRLVRAVVEAARDRFRSLRLRTGSAEAAAFYERLGFRRLARVPQSTHALDLGGGTEEAR
jgi:GNAT superfamily N-acetyltransferase